MCHDWRTKLKQGQSWYKTKFLHLFHRHSIIIIMQIPYFNKECVFKCFSPRNKAFKFVHLVYASFSKKVIQSDLQHCVAREDNGTVISVIGVLAIKL